ncbi:heterokaryon incompatibility protein-domain-containing protein [Daldinia loculata]|nr:heterokaryon incompatibility protein-domain-containing protein [Daldinia loculata]
MATNSASNPPSPNAGVYAPLGPNQARLIEILPSDDDDQPVSCLLRTAELTPDLHYAALSYVWGDPKVTRDILINGHILPVTTNLACALWYFRKGGFPNNELTGKIRFLWVDALCINQEDTAERSHQVTLMGTIYRNASSVLSWLEDPELGHINTVFPLIRGLPSKMESIAQSWDKDAWERDKDGCLTATRRAGLEWLLSEPEKMRPFMKLSKCTYWTRIWIVREMALAKIPIIHWFICGHDSVNFTQLALFDAWILFIFKAEFELALDIFTVGSRMVWRLVHLAVQDLIANTLFELEAIETFMEIDGRDKLVDRIVRGDPLFSLAHLLEGPGHADLSRSTCLFDKVQVAGIRTFATDPRDMVYSVLDLSYTDIVPDYTKSVREVYLNVVGNEATRLAGSYLQLSGRAYNIENEHNLPSWLPDFTNQATCAYISITYRPKLLKGFKLLEGIKFREPEIVNQETLRIQGAALDSIKHVKRIPGYCKDHDKMIYQLCVDYLVDWMVPNEAARGEYGVGSWLCRLNRPLEKLLAALRWDAPDDDEVSHFRCFCGPRMPVYTWEFMIFLLTGSNILSEGEMKDAKRRLELPSVIPLEKFMAHCLVDLEKVTSKDEDNNEGHWNFWYRGITPDMLLFQTYGGRLGVGPNGLKPGDTVCVVDRAPSPIVLRKDDLSENESSPLVHMGACFVVGLLDEKPAEMVKRGELEIETFEIH